MLWAEAAAGETGLRPVFASRDADFRASFARSLQAAVIDGSLRPIDAEAVAASIVGQLRGIALQRVLTPNDIDLRALRQSIATILQGRPGSDPLTNTRKSPPSAG